jgi:hypothetical protein
MTRDCLDAWDFVMILADKNVLPCCHYKPVGSLNEEKSLNEILNGPQALELRERLLTGDLDEICMQCHDKGWIKKDQFQTKIKKLCVAQDI